MNYLNKKSVGAPLSLALCIAMAGCGGGGGSSNSTSTKDTLIVPTAGGTGVDRTGAIKVQVEANAVARDTTEIVSVPFGLPQSAQIVPGTAFKFLTLDLPSNATVTISFSPTALPTGVSATTLQLCKLINGIWVPLTSTVNTANSTVSASTNSLTTFALLPSSAL